MAGKDGSEKIEYMFVDIEWYQTPGTKGIENRDLIQIGVIATDEIMDIKKSFSMVMRSDSEKKYNPDTLISSHSILNSGIQDNGEEAVLQKIKMMFPDYKYIVGWTNDAYELFKRDMDKYGLVMPKHRTIVFQQILMRIASNGVAPIGFEHALIQTGIEYQKSNLHNSKYDVNYMYQLFCKCYNEYTRWTNGEICYLNKNTHIIPTNSCRYINRKKSSDVKTTKNVIFQGNRVCKICGCDDTWNRLQWGISSGTNQNNRVAYLRKLPLTDENISKICNKFRLDYNVATDVVFIRTRFSRWIIHIENDIVTELQHENYNPRRNEAFKVHKKCLGGYHKQKLPSKYFYDVVSYIKYHDDGMLQKLGNKRSRIEILFDKISEQETENMA